MEKQSAGRTRPGKVQANEFSCVSAGWALILVGTKWKEIESSFGNAASWLPVLVSLTLAAAQTAQLQAGNVSITVNRTDGSYVIGIKGQAASVLHSQVAAQIDRRWVRSNEYPRHEIRAEAFSDQLGPGHLLTITHTGEAAQPDLVCIVRAYSQRPFLNIEVQVRNRTTKDVTVQAIRSVEAIGTRMVYLGAEDSANRVLSDSYSEDRPEMVIYDLGKAPNGMHRAFSWGR